MTSVTCIEELVYSAKELKQIHTQACLLVEAMVNRLPATNRMPTELSGKPVSGIFVSLKRNNTLRGCCGIQGRNLELYKALEHFTHRTALNDHRFAPVVRQELAFLDLSVSILGPQQELVVRNDNDFRKIHICKSGLRIQVGDKAGLLLPSVARTRDWSAREFLEAVCQKAGLPEGSWRREDANLKIFTGVDFSAPLHLLHPPRVDNPIPHQLEVASIQRAAVSGIQELLTKKNQPRIFSVDCYASTENLIVCDKSPTRQGMREPAVSGRFYPADDAARNKMVDTWLRELPGVQPGRVAAAMVPHAGLRFSGKIACDVWRRIELPSTVIINGPKHTPHGANWAVSPLFTLGAV